MSQVELHEIHPEPPGEDVIAKLERVLEAAKAGQISSVGIAVVYRSGGTGAGWSAVNNWSLQIGAVARMQAEMLRSANEG